MSNLYKCHFTCVWSIKFLRIWVPLNIITKCLIQIILLNVFPLAKMKNMFITSVKTVSWAPTHWSAITLCSHLEISNLIYSKLTSSLSPWINGTPHQHNHLSRNPWSRPWLLHFPCCYTGPSGKSQCHSVLITVALYMTWNWEMWVS